MAPDALVALAPDVLADSLGDYLRAWWKRIRGGESGALPIIIGLIVICIFFEVQSSAFFTRGQHRQPVRPGRLHHPSGHGRALRPHPQRDRPVRRLRRRGGRRHRARPDRVPDGLALVGRP